MKAPEISYRLAAKLGSLVVHVNEATSPHGHPFDVEACRQLVNDPEVVEWIKGLQEQALVPAMRR
jgi:hypothetical protein